MWADNEHTVRGVAGHRRADSGSNTFERGSHTIRAMPLWSERYGLSGRADVVLFGAGGAVSPVEYKMGLATVEPLTFSSVPKRYASRRCLASPSRSDISGSPRPAVVWSFSSMFLCGWQVLMLLAR